MKNLYTYEQVKNYIEIESGSDCKLISKEYGYTRSILEIQCKCKNLFKTDFSTFKRFKKYTCDKCTMIIKRNMYKNEFKNVKTYIENLNYSLISNTYNNAHQKLHLKDFEGYEYSVSFKNIQEKKSSKKFHQSNPYTIQNIKLWLKLNNKSIELLSTQYIKATQNLEWKCLKCMGIFKTTWTLIQSDNGCDCFLGRRLTSSNCLAIKNPEISKEWHLTLNGNLTPYDVTCGMGKKVWWKCKKCGFEWKSTILNRTNRNGCPKCNESKGEKKINEYLNENNLNFEREYTFNNLLSDKENPLRFDFAIFNNTNKTDILFLLEFDGAFHYKKYYEEQNFEIQQYHDELKNKYCINNNIKLIRIPYWDFDNIETILNKELNNQKREVKNEKFKLKM